MKQEVYLKSPLEEILWLLPDQGAFKLGPHSLKKSKIQDPPAPYYVNLRNLRSYPETVRKMAEVFGNFIHSRAVFDKIVDVPTAATPFVSALSVTKSWPMISPRMDKKEYGSGQKIDGVYEIGERVVVIDDVLTNGESKLESIKILEAEHLFVRDIVVFLDRLEGGTVELEKAGYRVHSLCTIDDLIGLLSRTGRITDDIVEIISMYRSGNIRYNWPNSESNFIYQIKPASEFITRT
ncbi:MAG TPA: hypothetical protein VLE47_02735 [Candidatus Saccharimonadales bacterium]|nr:hypothetical protein [Candidatus Saccharimonadales bacterium]